MTSWTRRTDDGTYGLVIEEPALCGLDRMCGDAGDIETGGVLVGWYSADLAVAVVREATPPPSDSRQGRSWFNRGVAGLRDMLRRRWRSKERSYYLGEWHYHPSQHVEPSSVDIEQMYTIREDPNYRCEEPLLVIFGRVGEGDERTARAFIFPRSVPHKELIRLPIKAMKPAGFGGG